MCTVAVHYLSFRPIEAFGFPLTLLPSRYGKGTGFDDSTAILKVSDMLQVMLNFLLNAALKRCPFPTTQFLWPQVAHLSQCFAP